MAAVALRMLAPRIPLILKTTLYHTLSWTEESSIWDLRTAVILTTLRDLLSGTSSSVSQAQNFMSNFPPPKGPIWISRVTMAAPQEDALRQLLFQVIDQLKETGLETYTQPDALPVSAEWTGFRKGVGMNEPEPSNMSDEEIYKQLMSQVESDVTVVYFHGGAYYMMDPATHRVTARKLANLTKGRVFNVRYRLAPQHPFPAAMLDCLIAYLSLLYPPDDSFHAPVKPEHIVFAGDSAGANMCLALILFLLHLQRSGQTTVPWHGKDVDLPLPAGIATNSAWCDLTRSSPSLFTNAHYDYLPPPRNRRQLGDPLPPQPPPCDIWPASPPRAEFYCDDSMLRHPLVSPLSASADMWKGAPPIFFCAGEEMLEDEIKFMAQRCHSVGVRVRWEGFEAMPHCFAMLLEWRSLRSKRCFDGWAEFISKAVELASGGGGNKGEDDKALSGACWIEYKTGKETELDIGSLSQMTDEQVSSAMRNAQDWKTKDCEAQYGTGGENGAAKL